MYEITLSIIAAAILSLAQVVESRYCTHTDANGSTTYVMCASYEYCCGRSCCRSPTLTFYQLWYFWLLVILTLLLCSGAGWWYRFRYHGHIYTQPSVPGTNAFYYPQSDQVYLPAQSMYKDVRYPQQAYGPPPATGASHGSQQYQYGPPYSGGMGQPIAPPLIGAASVSTPPQPPPYAEPPPSYESVIRDDKHWHKILSARSIIL